MCDRWPPREELCALVQGRLSRGIGPHDDDLGSLVNAIRQRWPHLSPSTALHFARIGHITDWAPQPRPAPIDLGCTPPTLANIADNGAKHLVPHCARCTWNAPVPLMPLIERFGADLPLPELQPAFLCSWCQGRAYTVRDDGPHRAPGTRLQRLMDEAYYGRRPR